MKKVFLVLAFAAMIISCSLNDDEGQNVSYQYARITDVDLPDTLELGNSYNFRITSEVSECSVFDRFDDRQIDDSTLTVAVLNRISLRENCNTMTDTVVNSVGLNVPSRNNTFKTYTFRFLQGADANDEPIFLTRSIPIKASSN